MCSSPAQKLDNRLSESDEVSVCLLLATVVESDENSSIFQAVQRLRWMNTSKTIEKLVYRMMQIYIYKSV